MNWKPILVIGGLAAATAVGFAIVKSKTNGGAGTSPTPNGGSHYYAEIGTRDGRFVAYVYKDGKLAVSLGPSDEPTELLQLLANKMALEGASIYFAIRQDASSGAWWFVGYKNGASASEEMGPYATEALAVQAGTTWAQAAAVPVPTPTPA